MLFPKFFGLLVILAVAKARDSPKFMKTVPTISNSLVNLGKMEISFHFNGKQADTPQSDNNAQDYYSSPQAAEESCPCNNMKSPSFLSDPSEVINKILKSNDLFKDTSSTMCCESSEHVQESTVVFEVSPNTLPNVNTARSNFNAPQFSNFVRSPLFSNIMPFASSTNNKPKTVEIFMFPSKKNDNVGHFDFTNLWKPKKSKDASVLKTDLQIIKDGGIMQPSASVKKDLTIMEKKVNTGTTKAPKNELQTDSPPVTSTSNML